MASGQDHDALAGRITEVDARLARVEAALNGLTGALEGIRKELAELQRRNLATCPSCRTEFDMLAHHTSIGLFGNTVYVKCPGCHYQMPVEGRGGPARAVPE